jgi:hypothetical protein
MRADVKQRADTRPDSQPSAKATHEERIASLFRRWPAIDDQEARDLRRLWDERIRQAKQAR